MKCNKCGMEIDGTSDYCPYCGEPVPERLKTHGKRRRIIFVSVFVTVVVIAIGIFVLDCYGLIFNRSKKEKDVLNWIQKTTEACTYGWNTEIERYTGEEFRELFCEWIEACRIDDKTEWDFHVYAATDNRIFFSCCDDNNPDVSVLGELVKSDGHYVYAGTSSVANDFPTFKCKKCSGEGVVKSSTKTVCPFCSGTGQQYVPNLYYYANMGWQGGYTICSGCAGSGYAPAGTIVTCPKCNGYGFHQ